MVRDLRSQRTAHDMFDGQGAANPLDQSPKQHEQIIRWIADDLELIASRIAAARLPSRSLPTASLGSFTKTMAAYRQQAKPVTAHHIFSITSTLLTQLILDLLLFWQQSDWVILNCFSL
jgi:hypothetical protein